MLLFTISIIQYIFNLYALYSSLNYFLNTCLGKETGQWYLDLKNGSGAVGTGTAQSSPDVTFVMQDNDFEKMFAGKKYLFSSISGLEK
jgi:hypothetical protein